MKSIRQLLRQPLRSLLGMLLVALAVAVLCVSFSQTLAADQTAAKLKETFATVALTMNMTDEEAQWVASFAAEHPDIVRADLSHGLASAWIPELTQDNETTHLTQVAQMNDHYLSQPKGPVYANAMLEVTLTDVRDEEGVENYYRPTTDATGITAMPRSYPEGYTVTLLGTVDRVLGLESGYHDPTGYTVRIYLRLPDREAYENLNLQAGGRYLIYTQDYVDVDFLLRNWYMDAGKIFFWDRTYEVPYWNMDSLTVTEKRVIDWTAYGAAGPGASPEDFYVTEYSYRCTLGDMVTSLKGNTAQMFRTAEVILESKGAGGKYENPTIAALEGTAEEFLESQAGSLWARALEDLKINMDAYPVIAVDSLRGYADFAGGKANVTVGREFTEEEQTSGAPVCILSKTMAERCGLAVGDTLTLNYFTYDYDNPYQEFIRDGKGLVNPTAYRYRSETMNMTDALTYTIVGLYEHQTPWGPVDNNFFQFTPNTVFVPSASVTGDLDTSNSGMFRTLVLDGDRMRDMQLLTVEADMDHLFFYYDNGYTEMAASLRGFQEAAWQVLPLGLIVYGVLMLLFLFLFPGRQGRELATMDSLGAGTLRKVGHVLRSTLGILIPGSAIGGAVGLALWDYVGRALADYMGTEVDLVLEPASLWLVDGVQMGAVAVVTALGALVLAGRMDLMKRR